MRSISARDGRIEVGILRLEWHDGGLVTRRNCSPQGVLVDSFHSHLLEDDWSRGLIFRNTIKPDIKPIIRGWRVEADERELRRKLTRPHHNREVIEHFLTKYLPHLPETPSRDPPHPASPPKNPAAKSEPDNVGLASCLSRVAFHRAVQMESDGLQRTRSPESLCDLAPPPRMP